MSLELASEKRYGIFPFIAQMLVTLVKLMLDTQVSQGSKEGTGFESRQVFVNFTNRVTVWPWDSHHFSQVEFAHLSKTDYIPPLKDYDEERLWMR